MDNELLEHNNHTILTVKSEIPCLQAITCHCILHACTVQYASYQFNCRNHRTMLCHIYKYNKDVQYRINLLTFIQTEMLIMFQGHKAVSERCVSMKN